MNLLDNAGDTMDSMLPASSNTAAHVETFQSLALWQEAQNQLGAGQLGVFHPQLSDRRELLVEILAIVRGAEQASLGKRWKWKNRKGEVVILRDVFGKMVVWIEKLKSIGDIIIQYDPIHSALPWAAARFVLQVNQDSSAVPLTHSR
ncbi:hypothetical protein B0O99DRAFT_614393 [Bisporella sp. PMI_857]|nr:hypothetical protein B0O99DRAFT_614393 [Bisporella sp. PMI_857]